MNYKIQIDGLRFFAVIAVLVGHWISWEAYNPVLKHAPWGHGVILFFVISGFLITDILLNQKEKITNGESTIGKSLKVFYVRRFLRIFPAYYLLLFFLYYVNYPKTRELFIWFVTYTSNIYQSITNEYVGNFNHLWSLAVEEQFYIVWPFLIFFIPKKHLLKFFIATIIVSFISRLTCHCLYPEKWMLAAYFTPNLFLPLVLGAFLAFIKKENVVFFYNFFKPRLAYVGLVIYGLLYYYFSFKQANSFYNAVLDEYLFAVVSAFFVATSSISGFSGITDLLLTNKFSNYIGRISYGVYLIHLFIPAFFWDVFTQNTHIHTDNKKTAWAFYFILCFTAAALSYRFIEKPINALKKRVGY